MRKKNQSLPPFENRDQQVQNLSKAGAPGYFSHFFISSVNSTSYHSRFHS
jgi:hypothetical protein